MMRSSSIFSSTRRSFWRGLTLSIAALACASAACGGATAGDNEGGRIPAEPPANPPTVTTPPGRDQGPTGQPTQSPPRGGPVAIPANATVTFTSKGGFAANGKDSTLCTVVDETYVFDFATGMLTWKVCETNADFTANSFVTASKTLTAAESAPLRAALANVHAFQPSTPCAADYPTKTLEIASTTGTATELLHDQWDQCANQAYVHVLGLDDVDVELTKLSTH